MRLLLDTHLLLWVMADAPALSSRARAEIADDFDAPLPDDVLASFEGRE